jgi:hypothetical protein
LCPPAFKLRASNNADNVNLTPKQTNGMYKISHWSFYFLPGFNDCWKERPTWQILLTFALTTVWGSSWYFDANANLVWFDPAVHANCTPVSRRSLIRW